MKVTFFVSGTTDVETYNLYPGLSIVLDPLGPLLHKDAPLFRIMGKTVQVGIHGELAWELVSQRLLLASRD